MVEADPQVRVRLDLSYDGTDFSGWAAQPGRRTVQAVVEDALATVLRVPTIGLTVAGRTDAGVHAIGQVAHADLAEPPGPSLLTRLSGVLPPDVRITGLRSVPTEFDARFAEGDAARMSAVLARETDLWMRQMPQASEQLRGSRCQRKRWRGRKPWEAVRPSAHLSGW